MEVLFSPSSQAYIHIHHYAFMYLKQAHLRMPVFDHRLQPIKPLSTGGRVLTMSLGTPGSGSSELITPKQAVLKDLLHVYSVSGSWGIGFCGDILVQFLHDLNHFTADIFILENNSKGDLQ